MKGILNLNFKIFANKSLKSQITKKQMTNKYQYSISKPKLQAATGTFEIL